jgi:hypothetical protein
MAQNDLYMNDIGMLLERKDGSFVYLLTAFTINGTEGGVALDESVLSKERNFHSLECNLYDILYSIEKEMVRKL